MSFIVDTGSVESLIPIDLLKKFCPSPCIQKTDQLIIGITGHSLKILGFCMINIIRDGTRFLCKFLVSTTGPAIIGLTVMKQLKFQLSLYSIPAVESELKDLVQKCTRVTGGMKIPKVKLEVAGDPLFLKRRIIAFGLRDSVERTLNHW